MRTVVFDRQLAHYIRVIIRERSLDERYLNPLPSGLRLIHPWNFGKGSNVARFIDFCKGEDMVVEAVDSDADADRKKSEH